MISLIMKINTLVLGKIIALSKKVNQVDSITVADIWKRKDGKIFPVFSFMLQPKLHTRGMIPIKMMKKQ